MEIIIVCIVVALVAAFLVTGAMKSQLKSVRRENAAGCYTVDGSFRLSHQQDVFLYRNVTRRERPNNDQKGRF